MIKKIPLIIITILIAVVSSLIGYSIAMGLLFIAKIFMPNIPIVFDSMALILTLGISIIVGALAGWRPASKAAKLEPVLTLRAQ